MMKNNPRGVKLPAPRLPSSLRASKGIVSTMLEISIAILTDQEHEQSASDELAEELTSLCQEWSRIRAENASCRSFKSYCSDASTSLKYINCAFVVGVDHTGCAHGSKNLSDHVDWKFPPWEFAVHAIRESDGGVEVSS
jgi:hypothetical protein